MLEDFSDLPLHWVLKGVDVLVQNCTMMSVPNERRMFCARISHLLTGRLGELRGEEFDPR
jgi:hypothetical protein